MISAKQWGEIYRGDEVKRTRDGAVLNVAAKYQDRDGSVRFLCRDTQGNTTMLLGSELDLAAKRNVGGRPIR
ncbi:hypothetical protein MMMDOFMJ_4323 [Methylobacterium gnaphalii]|uniref:Uncharacterized protein n=1 Tax=Methylobacterium gnaphalii TaxID=1010610 RepID=A0A512JRU1_9HYPH|nr:hypothetical protein MGN01_45060 [Methylobacterium gnaphalii]GJD71367.1 hypothetical protein MMMDOFMJ_4323 [Methylobacterium gnaphalii]GLS51383.1 hypothetical protein GCM10007885_42400 [Methylobacterium gnaphalii]